MTILSTANVAILIATGESEKIVREESPRPVAADNACAMPWSSKDVLEVVSVVGQAKSKWGS